MSKTTPKNPTSCVPLISLREHFSTPTQQKQHIEREKKDKTQQKKKQVEELTVLH